MISIKPLRTIALLGATFLSMAAVPAAKRVPGFTFESVTAAGTNNPNAPAGAGSFGMTTRSIVTAAGASRMDVVSIEGTSQVYTVGDYLIVKDGKMFLVHPATKTFVDLMENVSAGLANLPPQILSQLMITDVTGKTEEIGSETIDGRPTNHRRVTIGYSMAMMGQSFPTTIVSDYWLAKIPAQIWNPLAPPKTEAMLEKAGAMMELAKKQIELSPKPADGVPLKMIIATNATMMGRTMGTTITTEIKNFKEGDVDASRIAVPTDYTKVAK